MPLDHFAELGQPRRPSLDADALKDHFHRLTAEHHPDIAGDGGRFTTLNAAYTVLREPAARLRHLLELDAPAALAAPAEPIAPALAEQFMEVAALQQKVESLGRERSAAHSPLARALVTSAGAGLRGEIERSLAKVEDARTRCLNCIRAEDAAWESRTGETVSRLVAVQREISFLNRWSDQLREGVLQLSL